MQRQAGCHTSCSVDISLKRLPQSEVIRFTACRLAFSQCLRLTSFARISGRKVWKDDQPFSFFPSSIRKTTLDLWGWYWGLDLYIYFVLSFWDSNAFCCSCATVSLLISTEMHIFLWKNHCLTLLSFSMWLRRRRNLKQIYICKPDFLLWIS